MKRTCLALLTVVILLESWIDPLIHAASVPGTKLTMDNGLTVLITEMPSSPVVSVYALIKAGSATEEPYLGSGVSHFLEHMLFKGTAERGVGEIASQIQAVGGTINASTGLDYTIYTITVPYDSFAIALDILADMIMHSTIDAVELERERQVILGEMRMHNDNPDRRLSELVFRTVYFIHPYKHPIIGYESLFRGLSRQDVVDYYQTHYVPNNMILSVAGNITQKEILPQVEKTFKDWKRTPDVVRNLPQEPVQISPRHHENMYPTTLTRMSMGFSSVPLLHQDLYALDVLAKVLGQGASSRLYLDVYKKRNLVHFITASNFTPMDKGIFEIECVLDENNVALTQQAVWENINAVKAKGIKKEELEKAKRQVLSEHILTQQTSARVAYNQALDEAFTGDHDFSRKYVEEIRNVSLEDIQNAAQKYLIEQKLTVVVLRPKKDESENPAGVQKENAGQIEKFDFENGMKVLMREDRTFPIVSVRLVLNGGTRQETAELNGLFSMLSSAWLKGTKSQSSEEIAHKTESLGMKLGSYSGRNSFGLSFEFLSEDLPAALEMLEDIVKNAVFPEDEIFKVKENLKAQIAQRDDDIFDFTSRSLKGILFLTHPLRLEEEGTVESVNRIQRQDILDFYNQFVSPGNMVLTVFGDIQPQAVLEDIKKRFGSLKGQPASLKLYSEKPLDQPREIELSMDKEQALVMFGFHGVPLNHPDYYGMKVMTSVLGSSFSGRLFNTIREQFGQAYSLGGQFIPVVDAGMIYFYVLTNDKDAAEVKDLLRKQIEKLQNNYVTDEELEDVKKYLKGNFRAGLETNSALSFTSGLDELYGLGFDNYQRYDAEIDQVTKADIRRLAMRYLDLNKAAVVVTKPKMESKEKWTKQN